MPSVRGLAAFVPHGPRTSFPGFAMIVVGNLDHSALQTVDVLAAIGFPALDIVCPTERNPFKCWVCDPFRRISSFGREVALT